ncbi:MAG: hypothetical protein QM727_12140 [Niabella sp.]
MKIKFFNPNSLDRNLKATIHKSGKLGFTVDAANKMELKSSISASVGMNEDDEKDKSLYIMLHDEIIDDTFRVAKAGDYYYLNLKSLFDTLRVNYKEQSIIYDITEEVIDGKKLYKLTQRENGKKNKNEIAESNL